jgi:hypothetical protein
MKKNVKRTFISILLIILANLSFSDERPPIDIMLAVDVSNSMAEEMEAVKGYINNNFLENYVQIGDYLLILIFYATTEVPVSMTINSKADLEKAKQTVSSFLGNHAWTDIGHALDVLNLYAGVYAQDGRDKFLIIITDGEQTAPWSKYTTKDGKVNHILLENAYTALAKEGWKVQFLVSGGSDIIKEMAEKIAGTYTEISEKPTEGELTEKVQEPGGIIKIITRPEKIVVTYGGAGTLPLTIESSGFKKEQAVSLNDIIFSSSATGEVGVLTKQYGFSIQPGESKTIEIPVKFPENLVSGDYRGDFVFNFASQAIITPGRLEAQIHVNSLLENFFWLIPIGILIVVLLIVLLVLLLKKRAKGRTLHFKLIIEEEPLKEGKDSFAIRIGQILYFNESLDIFSLVAQKSPRSIARLTGQDGAIKFEVLKEDQLLNVKKMKGNILGEKLEVMTSSGKKMHITFHK